MRKNEDIQKDIMDVMRELHEAGIRGLRARNIERDKREELKKRLDELRREEEERRAQDLREWLTRLKTLALEGDKKNVIEIYKMCVRHCIKADAVFGNIEDGKFVYFDKKLEREERVDVPEEFDASMVSGLDLTNYTMIKHKIVPGDFMFERIVGKHAKELGIEI